MKSAILLLLLFAAYAFGATDQPPIDPADDFAPGLGLFALFAIIIMLMLIGVGVVIAFAVAVCLIIFVALGIVSSSALLGVYRRRFSTGLRALHYQLCALAALPAGVGALWLCSHLFNLHLRSRDILAIGSFGGIFGGLLIAFAFDHLASVAYHRLVTRALPHGTENT